jgi:hypothetical protein
VCQHARDGAVDDGSQLGLDQGADLRLRLRDREPERERWSLVGGAFLPQELVAHLRAVSVREDEPRLVEQRPKRGRGAAEVRKLLGCRSPLARTHQRVAAERDNYGVQRSHLAADAAAAVDKRDATTA